MLVRLLRQQQSARTARTEKVERCLFILLDIWTVFRVFKMDELFKPLTRNAGFKNARVRFYYKGNQKIWLDTLVCSQKIFNPSKLECTKSSNRKPRSNISETDPEYVERAARRARNKVFELCLCNEDLRYFATLTLDKTVINRESYADIIKKLNAWLDYRVRKNGLKYIMVAEYHSNGAIHFHALFNDALEVVDSGCVIIPERSKPVKLSTAKRLGSNPEFWQTVYNIPSWKYGFSTFMDCEEGNQSHTREATCGYISKYITKGGKCGGRYYLSGGDLKRPEAVFFDADFNLSMSDKSDSNQIEKEFEICGVNYKKIKPFKYGLNNGGQ